MKVAVLYISTGKYTVFWKDFYKSAEKYFFKNDDKTYFVFTDAKKMYHSKRANVRLIPQENLGWPGNTLFRFKIFKKIEKELEKYDLIFFLNGNSLFKDDVGREILPKNKEEIIVIKHPGLYNKDRSTYQFETNKESLAYIAPDEGKYYVCGGFNGGYTSSYLKMINELDKNTDIDYQKGIVAWWHDESHINRYIIDHPYHLLSEKYMAPEEDKTITNPKVIVRDKKKYGGHDVLRGLKKEPIIRKIIRKTKVGKIKRGIKKIIKKLFK